VYDQITTAKLVIALPSDENDWVNQRVGNGFGFLSCVVYLFTEKENGSRQCREPFYVLAG
jgi:hypothetical protein